MIKDLYQVDIAEGTVSNVEERVASALDSIYERIHQFVIGGKLCKHFDETGWRDSGERHFVWLACCEGAAFYRIDRNRNAQAFKKLIRKEEWREASVTDRYSVYKSFTVHQYCLAHLIREFRGYAERESEDQEIGKELEKELGLICKIH